MTPERPTTHLCTSLLYPPSECCNLVLVVKLDCRLALRQHGDDGDTSMAPDDRDADTKRVYTVDLANEGARSDYVQRGHAKDAPGVKDSSLDQEINK